MSIELVNALLYIGDGVKDLAEAMKNIHEDLEEFNKCACSVDALGEIATHPTIKINKE